MTTHPPDPSMHYEGAGVTIAVSLVNDVAVDHAFGRPIPRGNNVFEAVHEILMIDPSYAKQLRQTHIPAFAALAGELRSVFFDLDQHDMDRAAARLNALLALHPAHPHLEKENDRWLVHHHPADAALVPMVTAVCAEGLARTIGTGDADRLGTCGSPGCDRVFFDESKNVSRRFCSTACQNRVKAAAFRRRQSRIAGRRTVGSD